MKISALGLALALTTMPVMAQVAAPSVAPLPRAPQMATVTPFITGLKEPQGMAMDPFGNLYICDYSAGEILKFSREGTPLGKLATGLKGPSQIVLGNPVSKIGWDENSFPFTAYVTERQADRVSKVSREGTVISVGNQVLQPVSLVKMPGDEMIVISQQNPKVLRWVSYRSFINNRSSDSESHWFQQGRQSGRWEVIYSPPSTQKAQYNFKGLVNDAGSYFVSDEIGHQILMLTEGGRLATFATGISKPIGLSIGPDKMLYVANEGDGGQLIRLNNEGKPTVVAEKLGRPNSILFLDAKTALVSNRDGNIWKIAFP